MFVGFGSIILRVIYGIVFGLVNIQRMDIPTLAYVYEGFDAGYGAYVGFHIVKKTHTHPIALSFISLLLEMKNGKSRAKSKKSDAFLRAQVSETIDLGNSKRAKCLVRPNLCNSWFEADSKRFFRQTGS